MTLAIYQVTVSHVEDVAVGSHMVVDDNRAGPDGGAVRDLGWFGVRIADLSPGSDGQAYTCPDCEAASSGTCEAHRTQPW